MPRVSAFKFLRICLLASTLFIITTYMLEIGDKISEILLGEQTSAASPPSCERIPDRQSIRIDNLYWQKLTKGKVSFYFYNAYYDIRHNSPVRPAIRVTAMVDIKDPPPLYCRIWLSSETSVIVKVHEYHFMWFKHWKLKTELQPFLVTCPIPKTHSQAVPQYVSFVTRNETCEPVKNVLRVMYDRSEEPRKRFAVCVKGLDYPEDGNGASTRLVEWIEMQWLLGVDRVIFYVLQIHPNMRAILEYYKSQGRVQVIPLTLPGNQPNEPKAQHEYLAKNKRQKRLNEVIPYNDCFYRNLYLYEYVALLDTDEVIVPLGAGSTWSQMLEEVSAKANKTCNKRGGITSYMARNVYFMDDLLHKSHDWFEDIPRYMHMLQHVYRTANDTGGSYPKGLHRTDNALTLHNHFPFSYLTDVCQFYKMDPRDALLHHYRTYCVEDMRRTECEALRKNVVRDTSMWRYKDVLTDRTTRTLTALGLLVRNSTQAAITQSR